MPVLCHLVTMVTLVRGTDRALLCVSARVEAPPSRALPRPPGPISCPLVENCAFERRSCFPEEEKGPRLEPPQHKHHQTSPVSSRRRHFKPWLCNTLPRLCGLVCGRLGQTLWFIFVTMFFLISIFLKTEGERLLLLGVFFLRDRSHNLRATFQRRSVMHSGSGLLHSVQAFTVFQGTYLFGRPTYQTEWHENMSGCV